MRFSEFGITLDCGVVGETSFKVFAGLEESVSLAEILVSVAAAAEAEKRSYSTAGDEQTLSDEPMKPSATEDQRLLPTILL
jgi:hypothetical protein